MNFELIIIGALSAIGIIATVRAVATDGYRRIPTRRYHQMP
ncbi:MULTISPECIES: hypothetical protein [unclassified Salinibacterium]|nr:MULTISPECIES: hypothetical protein [unclassified Salinibacterium]